MAQPSDDCFAGTEKLMGANDALRLLVERVTPITSPETVELKKAGGRTLAQDVSSSINVPQHTNSAVDGYAVYFTDLNLQKPTVLPIGGRATAGNPLDRSAKPGEAIRIFTGAVMPEGPDTVMMQEDCDEKNGKIIIRPGITQGANMRAMGEDIRAGRVILEKGIRLRSQDIGIAAAIGQTGLIVYKQISVAIFSTGNEVTEPGATLFPGKIYDSNRYATITALERLGCKVDDFGILSDHPDEIAVAMRKAAEAHDLIVTSGGMSVGEEDYVGKTIEKIGNLHFWRLAIKPGRPVCLGQVRSKDHTAAFLGLPGNPVATMVTFMLIGRPLILRLGGAKKIAPIAYQVLADFEYSKKKNRQEYVRVRLIADKDGLLRAQKHGSSGAGILSSMVGADGLVELPEDMEYLDHGSTVNFLPFSEVLS